LTITPYGFGGPYWGTSVSGTITGLEYTDDTPVNGYVKVKIAVNIPGYPGYPGYNGDETVTLTFADGQASFTVAFANAWGVNQSHVTITIVPADV
jgi:hypothetical protein